MEAGAGRRHPGFRRINLAETLLVIAIVFAAPFMTRGAWLF
jgi:hypothetical protein